MSSSPTESYNAAPKEQVKPPTGDAISRDTTGDQHKTPRRIPPSRAISTSLLTQALETTYEVDESTPTSPSAPKFPLDPSLSLSATPRNGTQAPHHHDAHYNQSLTLLQSDGTQDTKDSMAVTIAGPPGDLRVDSGLGGKLRLSPGDFMFHSLFTNRRPTIGNNRGRGTSLERTEREKRIHIPPKESYNPNPGDTGLPRTFNPDSPITPTAFSTTQPTEGTRARYRSWRDPQVGPAAEKTWSIGGNGDDNGGQVEKSITEAMTGVEPNSRSRKSSHSLRFFKEGLPDDPKLRESKNRGRSKESRNQKNLLLVDGIIARNGIMQSPKEMVYSPSWDRSPGLKSPMGPSSDVEKLKTPRRTTPSSLTGGLSAETGYFDMSADIKMSPGDQLKEMPAQLLADIRTHHNLTPGASKGSSFSRSIPVTESERTKLKTPSDELDQLLFDEVPERGAENGDSSPDKSHDEEEDSGEEQIASALFVPHKTPHDSPDRARRGSFGVSETKPHLSRKQTGTASPIWLEEHEVLPSKHLEAKIDSLLQETVAQSLSGTPKKVDDPVFKRVVNALDRFDTQTPRKDSAFTEFETSIIVEDNEITPTGSLKETNHLEEIYHQPLFSPPPIEEPKVKQALDAIELIPYRHQVGGHTTMWRFSKRAVCKQLNNGENVFYEKVEHYHPELLPFLPRYVFNEPSLVSAKCMMKTTRIRPRMHCLKLVC